MTKKSNLQEFHLMPHSWSKEGRPELLDTYIEAFSRAEELYIVSAFLTEWPKFLALNEECAVFKLIVGLDFGTTRKSALEDAMAWLPERFRGNFLAFNAPNTSFHPKAMLWREHDGKNYFLVGSSNLTRAAFESNVEANITLQLDDYSYENARVWIEKIADGSTDIDAQLLANYREAPARNSSRREREEKSEKDEPILNLFLDLVSATEVWQVEKKLEERRARRQKFDKDSKEFLELAFREAAAKTYWTESDNASLYLTLHQYWSTPKSGTRMGGHQWAIRGKGSALQELAISLVSVLDARDSRRDAVVVEQKNRLHACSAPTRSAVFTEMLCHFFPDRYPIVDDPVIRWSRMVGFGLKGEDSEGERYLRLARMMRAGLHQPGPIKLGLRTLAELDVLIWFKFHKDGSNQFSGS